VGFFVHAGIYRRNGDNLRFFHDSYESYLGANALESEFREQRFDMVRQCADDPRPLARHTPPCTGGRGFDEGVLSGKQGPASYTSAKSES
jgi:hypothetical protein